MTVTATPWARQAVEPAQVDRGERHQLVAVDHDAVPVHRQHAVAVAVEGEPDVVALNAGGELLHVSRTAAVVDVAAVGLDGHGVDLRAEAPEDLRGDAVGGPVRAVEQHAAAGQVELGEARLELAQVVAGRAVQLAHAPDAPGRGLVDQALDLGLLVVAELGALRSEELDAVVGIRVVGRGHHRREVEAEATREQRGSGRGKHATEEGVPAARGDARGERRLEHLARFARVPDDQDLRGLGTRDAGRRTPQGGGQLGREELAGDAANAVRSEELAGAAPHREAPAAFHRPR